MNAAIFVLGTTGLIAFVLWSTHQTARILRTTRIEQNLLLLPAENALKLFIIALAVELGLLSGAPVSALGWTLPGLQTVLIGFAAGVVLWGPLNAVMWYSVRRWGRDIYSPLVLWNILPRSRVQWLLVPLAMVPAAALEELMFRSLILGGMGQWVPPLLLAAVASVTFGAAHVAQGRIGMVVTGALGMLLSVLFLATGSLAAVLIAHWVLNVLQLAVAEVHRKELQRLYPVPSLDAADEQAEPDSDAPNPSGDDV